MLKKWQISALESIEGWDEFLNEESSSDKKKKLLLEMARNGEPRPKSKKHPGVALSNYISKSSNAYDSEFDKKIRKLAPHWFVDAVAEKKKLLLEMAKNGEPRPKCVFGQKSNPLGRALRDYISKSSGSYDPTFDKQIRKLAPHWFN